MILVAHEDQTHSRVLARVLSMSGDWAASTVNDANQILARTREVRPDLLLLSAEFGCEYFSTDPTSFELVCLIRRDPAFADLPILMLCRGMEQEEMAAELGCTPSTLPGPEELIETVRRLLAPTEAPPSQVATSVAKLPSSSRDI